MAVTLAAVIGSAVINIVHVVQRTPARPRVASAAPPDIVTRQEKRLDALRAALVARGLRGSVGYVTDVAAGAVLADAARAEDYYLAQFVLLPAVLDLNYAAHAWVVANHRDAPAGLPELPGYVIESDFGDGVRLLRKAAP